MRNETLSKREENKINNREQILKASRRLFTSKGYEQTTMEDIAGRVGLTKATVYNYFPNKESLLIGTCEDVLEAGEAQLVADSDGLSTVDCLSRTLAVVVCASAKYPDLARRITYMNARTDSELYDTGRRMSEILVRIVERGQEKGELNKKIDPSEIADALIGLYFVSQFLWPDTPQDGMDDLEKEVSRRVADLLEGYRG